MTVANSLTGKTLSGHKLGNVWHVIEKIERTEESSGGMFSIGYRAKNIKTGEFAFLKASDPELILDGDGMTFERIALAVKMHGAERKIVEHCRGNNMDRIVTPLDFGDTILVAENGIKEPLFWIAFEWAQSDGREHRKRVQNYDFVWIAKAMHNLATAVSQLHAASICHNDIKPSNILVFADYLQKLGDLGRAISPNVDCPYSHECCIGDPRYASPEVLYGQDATKLSDLNLRKANDLYLLGSIGYFFVTGTMLSPAVLANIATEHRPYTLDGGWGDGFDAVLPHWRYAHTKTIYQLEQMMPSGLQILGQDYGKDFLLAITQLTEPDPALRGHPQEAALGQTYSVQRYVSLFNRLSIVAARST